MRLIFGCLLAIVVCCSCVSAADVVWTGWLGKQRDGSVEYFQPPSSWPDKLQKRWQVDVGTGYGSPTVAEERVFQHARQGEEEVVWCIELNSGEVVWRKSYEAPFKIGGGGEFHGKGPKSSPALADGRLFTLSITGVLSAWNTENGELLWRRDYSSRFSTTHPYWGVATSPLVDEDRVIVHFGNDESGVLVALDVSSGEEVWTHGKDGASYSSPLRAEIDGVRQIIEWNHRALVGVESETGKFLWEFPMPHIGSNQNMPSPVFHQGQILVGGENRGVFSFKPSRSGDAWQVVEQWHQDKVALDMSTAVVQNDLLFGFSHYSSGRLFCLDLDTGNIRWEGPPRTGNDARSRFSVTSRTARRKPGPSHPGRMTNRNMPAISAIAVPILLSTTASLRLDSIG